MTSIDNPDYWKLLGLEPDSSQEQLKRAFRQEARKWHPDLNGNDVRGNGTRRDLDPWDNDLYR